MKCSVGDRAKIVNCLHPDNLGKEVIVAEYIGFLEKGTLFYFRGIPCRSHITDHHWWVDSTDTSLVNQFGPTPRAFLPDSWLEPAVSTREQMTEFAFA